MRRLYLRFVAAILATFVVAFVAAAILLLATSKADVAVVEDSLRGGATLAAQRLDTAPDRARPAELRTLQARFDYPVVIVPAGHVPD